jgi:hypothetical protein
MTVGRPPALYSAYEREGHETWRASVSARLRRCILPGDTPNSSPIKRRNGMKSWITAELWKQPVIPGIALVVPMKVQRK